MSSDSDERSSSSPILEDPRRKEQQRSRSRSKEKQRKRYSDPSHGGQYQHRRVKIKVPQLTDHLMPFKAFQRMQSQQLSHQSSVKGYEKYKKDWEQRQNQAFLTQYRNDAWFRQKYDPQFLDAIQNQRKQNIKKTFKQFVTNFNDGVYKNINLSVADITALGFTSTIQKMEEDQQSFAALINNQFMDIILNSNHQIMRQPYFGFDPDHNTLFIMKIPRNISRFDIYQIASKIEGFKNITVSQPVKKNALARYCWIQFINEQACTKGAMTMSALIIKDQKIQVVKSNSKAKRVKIVKNYPISRMKDDLETILKLTQKLDSQCQVQNNVLYNAQFKSDRLKFDTFLLYLRRVHGYDYFTSTSYENQRALVLRLGSATLRIQAQYQQMQGVQTVFKKLQDMANKRIERGNDIPDYLGILREQIQKFIRESQKGKQGKQIWKCFQCDKKFKTCQFLAKHLIIKHNDIKDKKIQLLMNQAYIKDPNKITGFSLREDRGQQRGRRPRFQRPKRDYRDIDQPEGGDKTVKTTAKPLVNFLDI